MNHIYRIVLNASTGVRQAVCEVGKGLKKGKSQARKQRTGQIALAVSVLMSGGYAHAAVLPQGGQVAAGSANISTNGNTLNVAQSTDKASIHWQSFNIGKDAFVNFQQPSATSITLNRVIGNETSIIEGALNANGRIFLLNSNGILFTKDAQVNTGGIVATTLNLSDAEFMSGKTTFTANGSNGSVLNLGTITSSDGGYVALLGSQVKNEGIITAKLGTTVMAAGNKVSLNFNGNSLVGVTIDEGALNALVENNNAVIADGGLVVMTAKGLDTVLRTVVNNTGEVRAQTIGNAKGKIYLLGGFNNNQIEVGGTLDASAPTSGDGGFIETSAAQAKFADDVHITTKSTTGTSGEWLIDPNDFTVASSGGNITGAQIATALQTNGSVVITTTSSNSNYRVDGALQSGYAGTSGNGDIFINDNITLTGNLLNDTTFLTFKAYRNVILEAGKSIDATAGGNTKKLGVYLYSKSGNTEGAIQLKAGSSIKTNGGDIALCGDTGDGCGYTKGINSRPAFLNFGVLINNASLNSKGGSITIKGEGSSPGSTGGGNNTETTGDIGVAIINDSVIDSGGGAISIDGKGRDAPNDQSYDYNYGVWIGRTSYGPNGTQIISGAGKITITGTASSGQGSDGVKFYDPVFNPDTSMPNRVTSTSGNIEIIGSNNNSQTSDGYGVSFNNSGVQIKATTGSITITGTSSAPQSKDINFSNSIATATPSGNKPQVYIGDGSQTGNIILNVNSISLNNVDRENLTLIGQSKIIIQPRTSGVGIALNSSSPTARFNLKAEFFNRLWYFKEVIIGSTQTDQIAIGQSGAGNFGISETTYNYNYLNSNLTLIAGDIVVYQNFDWTKNGETPTLTLTASSSAYLQSASSSIKATNLLLNGAGAYRFKLAENNIGTLAAVGVSDLWLYNAGALTIGTVGTTNGITATGDIDIATKSNNLTIAQSISTTSTKSFQSSQNGPSYAITLNAGKSESAGTKTGGDVILSNSSSITIGTGGKAAIYTGSVAGSTGISDLVTSTNRTYNSDETSNLSLNSGTSAIYREDNPIIPLYLRLITGSSIYGDTPSFKYDLFDAASGGSAVSLAQPSGSITWSGAPTNTSNVGTYSITYASGITLGNSTYSLSAGDAVNWSVTARPLNLTAVKTYDGNPDFTTGFTLTGMANSDATPTVTGSAGVASKNASSTAYTAFSSNALNLSNTNYTLTGGTISATINKADITAVTGITANNKTYDATPSATLVTSNAGFTGKISSDVLNVATATGAFADKNAADGKTVSITGITLSGDDAGNYNLTSSTATTTANISKADITAITGITANNKTYDANPSATLVTNNAGFTGKIGGDLLNVATAIGAFSDKNAGDGKTVNITEITLSGDDAGNYNLKSSTATTTANIDKKSITINGSIVADKFYDGTDKASITLGTIAGLIEDEKLTLTGDGLFNSPEVGSKTAVISYKLANGVSGLAANYSALANTTHKAKISIDTKRENIITNAAPPPQITPISNPQTITKAAPKVLVESPQISNSFGNNAQLSIVSTPSANTPTQTVTLSEARSMIGGDREVRVPVSRNSLAEIVNGGVRLPNGVEQQLFVVKGN